MFSNSSARHVSFSHLLLLGAALTIGIAMVGCKDDKSAPSGGNGSSTAPTTTGSGQTPTGDKIIIGEYGSFTGDQSEFGTSTDEGVKLAVDETNAAGGIEQGGKKYQVQLETEDDESNADKAVTAVKRLIDEKNVSAIIGEVASKISLAGGAVCQDKGVPMISPSSTNVAVTQNRDYVFRVCFLDSYQAAVVARWAIDGLKAKRVAVYTNKSESYSKGFADEFKKAFTRYGGTIVSDRTYAGADTDFSGALTAIKDSHPDAILIPGYYKDAGTIAKQARSLGITVPLLGGDGWSANKLFQIGGDAVNGCYISDHMSLKDPKPVVQSFVSHFKDKYHHDPTSMSALGYDAAKILFDSIKRSKSLDKKDIRDAIAQTKDFDGVTGNITINAERNADKSAVIIAIKNGAFDYAATIPNPEQTLKQ